MEYQEKRSLVNLTTTIILFAVYYFYVYGQYTELGIADGTDLTFWAKYILWLIPYMVTLKIIVHIIMNIVTVALTKKEPKELEDEMDKLIDLKASRNGSVVFMFGFLFAMASLVMGYSPHTMFIVIYAAFIISGLITEGSMFYYYKRGV